MTLEPAPKMLRESGSYFHASSEEWLKSMIARVRERRNRRPAAVGRIVTGMLKRITVILMVVAALSALSACSGDADVRMNPVSGTRVETVR